jgi:GH15 family glucan-1,4-alpha-glucosidase
LGREVYDAHTYTTALVHRALVCAGDLAELLEFPVDADRWRNVAADIAKHADVFLDPKRGYLRKGFLLQDDGSLEFDDTLDVSSAYGSMMYATKMIGAAPIRQTFNGIEKLLLQSIAFWRIASV